MSTPQEPKALTMPEMLASLDPDLLRHFWRMQAARHKMEPDAFLTAYEALCDTADCIHRAMVVETWAPTAASQSSPVLSLEVPGLPLGTPAYLAPMVAAGKVREWEEDRRDNG